MSENMEKQNVSGEVQQGETPENESIQNQQEGLVIEKEPINWRKEIMGWVVYFVCLFGGIYLLVTYVGVMVQVDGSSMVDELHHNDRLVMDKLSYRFHEPERFDIVVFPSPIAENEQYIKRIIGLPGETIQIDQEGKIYIDGEVLEEDFGYEQILDPGIAAEPIILGEDEYFCMGDNRNVSLDSREIGPIHGEAFMGKTFFRLWPLSDIGFLDTTPGDGK